MSKKATPRTIQAAERQQQALDLRKAGATYTLIADKLGYASESGAYKAVQKALRAIGLDIQSEAKEQRQLALERLDRLLVAVWPKATQGHLGAVDRAVRIIERQCKILGLDAPEKKQHAVETTLRIEKAPESPIDAQDYLEKMLGSRHEM